MELKYPGKEGAFFNLSAFNLTSLHNYPDLAVIRGKMIGKMIQTVFASTGCDYISSFVGLGKSHIFNQLFRFAGFTALGNAPFIGSLELASSTDDSFMSFLRLIVCAYFTETRSWLYRGHTLVFVNVLLQSKLLSVRESQTVAGQS